MQQVSRFSELDHDTSPLLEWHAGLATARVPRARLLAQGWSVGPQHGETLASCPPHFLGQVAPVPALAQADFKPVCLPACRPH